jgi:hypothetical protein
MEIKFDKKPTQEDINVYCDKIAYFLSENKIVVSVDVNDIGVLTTSSVNGVVTSQERWWLGEFNVSSPWGNFRLRSMPRFGIDSSISEHDIWRDATMIQDEVYNHFKLDRGNPNNDNGYWSLWKKN